MNIIIDHDIWACLHKKQWAIKEPINSKDTWHFIKAGNKITTVDDWKNWNLREEHFISKSNETPEWAKENIEAYNKRQKRLSSERNKGVK